MEITYKVKKKNKNIEHAVIEKMGHTSEFTLRDVYNFLEDAEKEIRAKQAINQYNEARNKALLQEYPHFKKFDSLEELEAVLKYAQSFVTSVRNEADIKELRKTIKEYKSQLQDIYKAIPEARPSEYAQD